MNIMQRGVVTLLRSAITGECLPLPEGFDLEGADVLIKRQGLVPLVYPGAYNCGIDTQNDQMKEYKKLYFANMIRNEQQMMKVRKLFAVFDANGIDYVPMKGCILKGLYPQPEMRTMGDADVLIRIEQYDNIKNVMNRFGFTEDIWSHYDVHWSSKELLVELHYRLFSEEHEDICRYFEDGWSKVQKTSGSRYDFTAEDHYMYIFTHMTKHFRFGGVGARHITDLYVYRRTHPEMDEQQLDRVLEQLNLLKFHRNIQKVLAVWFEGAADEYVTDLITTYVFSGGAFGTLENELHSRELIRAQNSSGINHSKMRSILKMTFPPLSYLRLSYNVLFDHPWLFPVFWVVRWFDILLNRRTNIKKKGKLLLQISDEKISRHKQMLHEMGIDYYS